MSAEDKFCPSCATPLQIRDVEGWERPVCPKCGRIIYYDPKVAVTSVVLRDSKVLLVQRANDPGYGLWSMPGGYVDRGEVVEQAAAREVMEETGLRVAVERLIGLFSELGQPVMLVAFWAREVGGNLSAGDEALEVGFFDLCNLPPLAFPRDRQIIATCLGSENETRSTTP